MSKPVTLREKDDYVVAIRKKDGVAVQINCDGLDLAYCFAAMTAAIRNHFETHGCEELVNMLPERARTVMDAGGHDWSPAEWGLRWLYDQPEVTVVLSGMNSLDMVRENCRVASISGPGCLSGEDKAVLAEVTKAIRAGEKVGCTGCRYCMPCPKGVDIPGAFRCWNAMTIESKMQGRFQYAQTVGLTRSPAFATQCVGCGKCEQHCPQSIPIREKLKEADRALRPLPFRLGIGVARRFMFRKAGNRNKEDAS